MTGRWLGLGTALAVVPFLALLAAIRYEYWDYPSPAANILIEFVLMWVAILGLAGVGLVWLVRLYRCWTRDRRLPWTAVIAPLSVTVAAMVFVLVPTPGSRDFERAHGEMESLALSMLQNDDRRVGPTEVGGVRFSAVSIVDDCVYFVDSRRVSVVYDSGWVYTARCTVDPGDFARLNVLSDNWAEFQQGN
jgi:hypothetical protein